MKTGLKELKAALIATLNNVIVDAYGKVPVVELMPEQIIGFYVHIGDSVATWIGCKDSLIWDYRQTIRLIYEYNINNVKSVEKLDLLSDKVYQLLMAMSDDAVESFSVIELEMLNFRTQEFAGESGKRMTTHELLFKIIIQED